MRAVLARNVVSTIDDGQNAHGFAVRQGKIIAPRHHGLVFGLSVAMPAIRIKALNGARERPVEIDKPRARQLNS